MDTIYRNINRLVGKAIHDYDMITDGDRIAVGLSGGKDSFTLLWTLSERVSRIPVHYDLLAIYIDPGFDGGLSEPLNEYCDAMGVRLVVEHTQHGPLAHSDANRENPCFLCSRLRRKRLFEISSDHGFSKLALGHHKDDLIETLFMNIFYAGEISTMMPKQPFFDGKLTVIRPMAYVGEDAIRRFARRQGFSCPDNPCPSAGRSKRREIKEMLQPVYRRNRKVRGNIFRSMRHAKPEYLLK